jgi:hypothetical protein
MLFLIAGQARAGGIIERLPVDGAWARFDLEMESVNPKGERTKNALAKLTVSSVGSATVDGVPCRWIELKAIQSINKTTERISVFKLLIPERRFRDGTDPLDSVVQAWSRRGEVKKMPIGTRMDDFRRNRLPLNPYFHGRLENEMPLSPVEIECGLGKLACPGIAGTRTLSLEGTNDSIRFTHEVRTHDSAPFGVVEYRSESERFRDSVSTRRREILTFKLVEAGSGAISEIPEAK